jgi:glycerol dehydrogenase
LATLGLENASDEELGKIAAIACADKETIHNELIPVTPELVVAIIKVADGTGRRRDKAKKGQMQIRTDELILPKNIPRSRA